MPLASITIATALTQTSAKSIVDNFITPKLLKLEKLATVAGKTYLHDHWNNQFTEYIVNYYEKYSIINTIAFNNQQRLLKDLYIPLSVVRNDEKETLILDEYIEAFIPSYKKVIITDTAGMGKSTLTKRLFLSIVENNIGLPIIIELRRLNKEKKIIDEIFEQLSTIDKEADKLLVLELITRGDFIFFFDGYDEIGLDDRVSVTKDIQDFISKAGKNLFVITSRPEDSLISFGDFMSFHIKPLVKDEAFELLRKYNNYGELASLLIDKINEVFDNIREFLTNPLLVSLLYTAFEFKQTIPFKKHIFYRQVYDALFETHDLSKGDSYERSKIRKCVSLDREDFHRVLRYIGYECLKITKTEFTKDEIIELINKAKRFCSDLTFKEADFLKDITTSAPLFSIDGVYFKWSHKSLQEYFAAQFIHLDAQELQTKILLKLGSSDDIQSYLNILDLYNSIDPKTFKNVITHHLLSEYLNFYTATKEKLSFPEEMIADRISFQFLQNFVIIYSDNINKISQNRISDRVKERQKVDKLFIMAREIHDYSTGFRYGLVTKSSSKVNNNDLTYYALSSNKNYLDLLLLISRSQNLPFIELPQDEEDDIDYNMTLQNVEYNKPYLLNTASDNVLNSEENFEKVTQLVKRFRTYDFTFNFKKVEKYVREIEQDKYDSNKLMLDDF